MSNVKLITLMVLMVTLITGSALAGGDFKVYGKLHSSMNMLNNGDESQIGMTSNTSRFGIKGAQELNDDFSFIWKFESKLNMTDGSGTTLAQRNSYVGSQHAKAGKFLVGTHDTPFKTLGRKVEMFSDELGDFRMLTSRSQLASVPMGYMSEGGIDVYLASPETKWDNRLNEIVAWVSPNWDGFGLFLAA